VFVGLCFFVVGLGLCWSVVFLVVWGLSVHCWVWFAGWFLWGGCYEYAFVLVSYDGQGESLEDLSV